MFKCWLRTRTFGLEINMISKIQASEGEWDYDNLHLQSQLQAMYLPTPNQAPRPGTIVIDHVSVKGLAGVWADGGERNGQLTVVVGF